jgi:hypothetical protein
MPDDSNITHLHPRPRAACTGEDTGPVKRLDNIRVPADLVDGDALAKLGLGMGIPYSEGSTRVGYRMLRELRDRALSIGVAAAEKEAALLQAASWMERAVRMGHLERVEADTLAKLLAELLGEGPDEPRGAA